MKLSLVVPCCYNEADNVELFYEKAEAFSNETFDYEYIFINDGRRSNLC